ncbi:MAG: flavodoxin family protein [Actinomycetes bacterium]|nr:flavodoxin family protein [Actinomycetes bacterium]
MNVVIINGSPRANGTCARLTADLQREHVQTGHSVDVFSVARDHFRPCGGCQRCVQTKVCGITDDDIGRLFAALDAADELHWVAPVYFGAIPAQLKAVIDRMMVIWSRQGGIAADRSRRAFAHLTAASDDPYTDAMLVPLRYASNTLGFTLQVP